MVLHVFNPETDFARGSIQTYTPSKRVAELRRSMALLPALYAREGDSILLPCDVTPDELPRMAYYDSFQNKRLSIYGERTLAPDSVMPWGWDLSVRKEMIKRGIDDSILPSEDWIKRLRQLSHRRISIAFHSRYRQLVLSDKCVALPVELTSAEEAERWLNENPDAFLKAPWSSSGRGVMHTSLVKSKMVMEWVSGIVRSQGSVMAEVAMEKQLDCASEWWLTGGKAAFMGFSVFDTSDRSIYKGNRKLADSILQDMIFREASVDSGSLLAAQKEILEEIIGKTYEGPLGIDMLRDSNGVINPCVEINIRLTMGHISIAERDHVNFPLCF